LDAAAWRPARRRPHPASYSGAAPRQVGPEDAADVEVPAPALRGAASSGRERRRGSARRGAGGWSPEDDAGADDGDEDVVPLSSGGETEDEAELTAAEAAARRRRQARAARPIGAAASPQRARLRRGTDLDTRRQSAQELMSQWPGQEGACKHLDGAAAGVQTCRPGARRCTAPGAAHVSAGAPRRCAGRRGRIARPLKQRIRTYSKGMPRDGCSAAQARKAAQVERAAAKKRAERAAKAAAAKAAKAAAAAAAANAAAAAAAAAAEAEQQRAAAAAAAAADAERRAAERRAAARRAAAAAAAPAPALAAPRPSLKLKLGAKVLKLTDPGAPGLAQGPAAPAEAPPAADRKHPRLVRTALSRGHARRGVRWSAALWHSPISEREVFLGQGGRLSRVAVADIPCTSKVCLPT